MFSHQRFLVFAAFALCSASALAQQLPSYVSDQVIVAFQPGATGLAVSNAHSQAGAVPLRNFSRIGATLVQVAPGRVEAAIAAYSNNPNVLYAEPNYLRPLIIPNEGQDPQPPFGLGIDYFNEQYGLNNTGQSFYYDEFTGQPGAISGTPDADIDAPEAWDIHTGTSLVKVAVLDSGVDCAHPDLAGKCIENINLGPSADLADLIGHGTHVAGTIGATGNNGIGVAGVSWGAAIGAIKVCYEEYDFLFGLIGLCDSAAMIAGLEHAVVNGYQVANMSFGGPQSSMADAAAISDAWNAGVLLVAAAGNSYSQNLSYPAAYPEVIAVAASDYYDNLAGFSNFGADWVSLAAPGYYSFNVMPNALCGLPDGDPEGCYGWLSGTSMASPTVAGAAALVWSYLGAGATNASVRSILETSADKTGAMGQNMLVWTQYGRLNVHSAINAAGAPGGGGGGGAGPGAHVGDLDGSSSSSGPSWNAQVTIHVHDENELSAADGLVVQGFWSGGFSGSDSCAISGGQCTVSTGAMAKKNGAVTFAVMSITGSDYQSAANHDMDGDTNGTEITIFK